MLKTKRDTLHIADLPVIASLLLKSGTKGGWDPEMERGKLCENAKNSEPSRLAGVYSLLIGYNHGPTWGPCQGLN